MRGTQILLAAFTTYRRRFRRVAGAALLVLVPLAIVNAFLASETDRFERLTGWIPEWLYLLNSGAAAVGSLGAIFYAGLLDRVVATDQRGHPEYSLREVLRTLPYWRLIGADVLLIAVTVVGLVVFVVPGIVAYTYFSLIGPLIPRKGSGSGPRSVAPPGSSGAISGSCCCW